VRCTLSSRKHERTLGGGKKEIKMSGKKKR
jgi:hypothetical protein